MKNAFLLLAMTLLAAPQAVHAAIGCTLSNPAEDLKYLYPEMSTYKEELFEFPRLKDGATLFKALRERLGRNLDPIYETYETAYTVYSIYRGPEKIGIVHGVNVPGKGGVIQVFLSMDPKTAAIRSFFFQRLESPAARQLRSKEFRGQFEKLTLADFYKHDYYVAVDPKAKADKVAAIQPPVLDAGGRPDYEASLHGIRKNLILLDFFVYARRFEPYFERARQAADRAKKPTE
jgi:hypothetical protein